MNRVVTFRTLQNLFRDRSLEFTWFFGRFSVLDGQRFGFVSARSAQCLVFSTCWRRALATGVPLRGALEVPACPVSTGLWSISGQEPPLERFLGAR